MLRWAARNAFFTMTQSNIMDLLDHFGKKLLPGLSLLATVTEAIMKSLSCSEAKAMEYVKQRVALLKHAQEQVGDFLYLDEVQANLDQADMKEVKKMREKVKNENAQFHDLVSEIKTARSKPSFAKKAKADVESRYKGPKVFTAVSETLLQKDFKKFMPPNSYLWIARSEAAWFTRVPPAKPSPRYWRREGGEEPALRLAIQDAWRTWLEFEGMDPESCPVTGLFS